MESVLQAPRAHGSEAPLRHVSWPRCDGQSAQQPESSVVEEATNLVVLVPEADDALAASNMLLPRDKRLTAPAHITLVYPFLPSGAAVAASAEMESFFASLSPVSFRLHVGWFGSEVLILIPYPAEPLIHLTQSILDRWPEYPYYGGLYDKVEPHLSLGFGTAELLEPIAAAVEAYVPISVTITAVTLLVGPHDLNDGRPVVPPREIAGGQPFTRSRRSS